MNAGQLRLEVERILGGKRVHGVNRYDGEPISPAEIVARAQELAKETAK